MTSYLLVVNPASGRGRARGRAEALRSWLAPSHAVDIVETQRRGFACDVVEERARDFERVIAVGGDGTLNEVLGGLLRVGADAEDRPALGFLPSGTANAAVAAFGFSATPNTVARTLPEANVEKVDVGIASFGGAERPFLLWFGAGYDAVVIDALNSERTGLMGVAGLVRRTPSVLRAVHRYASPAVEVRVDGRETLVAASVILANVGKMGFGGTVADAADPFDGCLDLLTVPRLGTLRFAAMFGRMMISSLERGAGVGHTTVSRRVRLDSEGEVPFQLDGEPVGTLPVEVRVVQGAVRLLLT